MRSSEHSVQDVQLWEAFAREHGYQFTPPSAYPHNDLTIEAHVDGTEVSLSTRWKKNGGLETRVRAFARHTMIGRVEIRTSNWADGLMGLFRGRTTIGEADLDEELSAFTSSAALLRAILDPLTIAMLRALLSKPRIALVYENGAITLQWGGVELSPPLLDAAVKLAGYLALAGGAASPHR